MVRLIIKRHIQLIFVISFILFMCNKFIFRPLIIVNDAPQFLKIFTWSLPNFIEAVMGSIILTGGLFSLQIRYSATFQPMNVYYIYTLTTFLTGVYVLTQEVKWHNLGGRNVYDPNDFMASILGLLFMFGIYCKYGFKKEVKT